MRKFILFISSAFGTGYIKDAPGTFGSLTGLIIWILFAPQNYYEQIPIILCIVFVSIAFSSLAEEIYQSKDDQRIVIDEVAGMWIAVAFLPKTWLFFVLGFILFRVFDITKPLFIKKTQIFKGGLGITIDDIFAGIFANVILQVLNWYLI